MLPGFYKDNLGPRRVGTCRCAGEVRLSCRGWDLAIVGRSLLLEGGTCGFRQGMLGQQSLLPVKREGGKNVTTWKVQPEVKVEGVEVDF